MVICYLALSRIVPYCATKGRRCLRSRVAGVVSVVGVYFHRAQKPSTKLKNSHICFSSFARARDMSLYSAVSGCTVAKSFRKAGKTLTVAFPNDGLSGPPMRFTTLSVQSASQGSPRGRLRFFSRVSNGSCMTIRCTYCCFMPLFHSQQGLDVVYVC